MRIDSRESPRFALRIAGPSSLKKVPAVPVSGKMVPTVPVSSSFSVPGFSCHQKSRTFLDLLFLFFVNKSKETTKSNDFSSQTTQNAG